MREFESQPLADALHSPPLTVMAESTVIQLVVDRLNGSGYACYFKNVSAQFEGGRLTLEGRLPTFYLKQVLQSLLKDVPQVAEIYNCVLVEYSPQRNQA